MPIVPAGGTSTPATTQAQNKTQRRDVNKSLEDIKSGRAVNLSHNSKAAQNWKEKGVDQKIIDSVFIGSSKGGDQEADPANSETKAAAKEETSIPSKIWNGAKSVITAPYKLISGIFGGKKTGSAGAPASTSPAAQGENKGFLKKASDTVTWPVRTAWKGISSLWKSDKESKPAAKAAINENAIPIETVEAEDVGS